ncbi:MAG: hypothetical protein V7633_3120 [Pseudonocardia sp.]|jgi:hypothetical protein
MGALFALASSISYGLSDFLARAVLGRLRPAPGVRHRRGQAGVTRFQRSLNSRVSKNAMASTITPSANRRYQV